MPQLRPYAAPASPRSPANRPQRRPRRPAATVARVVRQSSRGDPGPRPGEPCRSPGSRSPRRPERGPRQPHRGQDRGSAIGTMAECQQTLGFLAPVWRRASPPWCGSGVLSARWPRRFRGAHGGRIPLDQGGNTARTIARNAQQMLHLAADARKPYGSRMAKPVLVWMSVETVAWVATAQGGRERGYTLASHGGRRRAAAAKQSQNQPPEIE